MVARSTLLALAVVLAVAASFALWAVFGSSSAPEAHHSRTVVPMKGSPMPRPPLVPPTPDERDGVETDNESRVEVPSETPPPGALPVRVVDTEGRPLSEIPVAIFAEAGEMPAPMPVVQAETREGDGLAWLAADLRGQELPAGMRLTVGVELPLEPRVERDLGAWLPGEPWDGETVELALPDGAAEWLQPLRVIVVDASGAPVPGVEVQLVERSRRVPSDESRIGRATTRSPDGVALLSRDEMRDRLRELAMLQVGVDHEVRCSGPFAPPPAVEVPGIPSSEPLRIVLPPTGDVEARLVRPDGAFVEGEASVSLEWFARGSDERVGYVTVLVEDGVARFERVGLGLDLRLGGSLKGGAAHATKVELPGPSRAGDVLRIDLKLGPEHPLLVGRLLLPDGAPAAEGSFYLAPDLVDPPPRHPAAGPRRLSWSYQATDEEGRFSVPWSGDTTAAGRLLRFEERPHPKLGAPEGWTPHFAVVPFPVLSSDGARLDLVDVELARIPVVVAGRVVDEDGAPVNQAWLSLRYPEGEGRNMTWTNLPVPGSTRVHSREDGTFEVRSPQTLSVLRISASHNSIGDSAAVEVLPGTTDVELVLEPREDFTSTRGRVLGSLRVDTGIPLLGIEVRLIGERGERSTYPIAGQVGFENVLPGTYSLVVRTEDSELVLDQIEGVVVQAGQVTRDARMQGIDLRGRLRVLRLRLSAQDGSALGRTGVWLFTGQDRAALRTDDEGRLTTLVRTQDDPLMIRAKGLAPLEVAWSPEEQALVLLPE